jgi:hypothetical protein
VNGNFNFSTITEHYKISTPLLEFAAVHWDTIETLYKQRVITAKTGRRSGGHTVCLIERIDVDACGTCPPDRVFRDGGRRRGAKSASTCF